MKEYYQHEVAKFLRKPIYWEPKVALTNLAILVILLIIFGGF